MEGIYFHGLNAQELKNLLNESFKEQLESIDLKNNREEEKLLTRSEAVDLLGITYPTLYDWTFKKGILNGYRIGRRIYYKYSEIMGSLKSINQKKCD